MLEWGDRVLREKQPVKYAFIKDNRQIFSTTIMCRVLSVKPSSYYDWLSRDLSEQQVHRNQCELIVKAAHSEMTHAVKSVEPNLGDFSYAAWR